MSEPGVPFPLRTIEEVLCRDCPFPAKTSWTEDFEHVFDKWRQGVLDTLQGRADPSGTIEAQLKGKRLVVLRPGQDALFDFQPNRVSIRVDENDTITNVSVGV